MNIEEAKEQLSGLIESWQLNEADLNQTDIDAIKCLLEENKKLHLRDTYTNITHNQFQIEKKEKRYYENILNELEKWLEECIEEGNKKITDAEYETIICYANAYEKALEKLQELKGSDK